MSPKDVDQSVRGWPAWLIDELRSFHHRWLPFSGNKDIFLGNCACVKKKKKKPLLLDFLLCLLTCDTLIFKTIKELKQKLLGIYLSSTSILD